MESIDQVTNIMLSKQFKELRNDRHVLATILEFYSKLNEFRSTEKCCDITVQVQGKAFKCHRLVLLMASSYFEVMFAGDFLESKTSNITLFGIDTIAFEEVVRYAYTGDVHITGENVFSVLRASDFLGLRGCIEEICLEFLRQNLPVPNILEIFTFAGFTRKTSLIGALNSYIMEHFNEFCDDDIILNFLPENWHALVDQSWYITDKNVNQLWNAIVRWARHDHEGRRKYFEELLKKMDFIPTELKAVIWESSESVPSAISLPPAPGLHIYIQSVSQRCIKVHSVYRSTTEWHASGSIESQSWWCCRSITNIAVQNHLYCLTECGYPYGPKVVQTFNAFTSLDDALSFSNARSLKPPPAVLSTRVMNMCNLQNIIYLSNCWQEEDCERPNRTENDLSFDDDEIAQGIYSYNIDVDKWFPVPLLCENYFKASKPITAHNGILYLAGEVDYSPKSLSLMALDTRMSKWQKLCQNQFQFFATSNFLRCTAHSDSIYISGDSVSSYKPAEVCRYDTIAGKWDMVQSTKNSTLSDYSITHLLSFENWLWAFGGRKDWVKSEYDLLEIYDAFTREWHLPPVCTLSKDVLWGRRVNDVVIF